MLEMGLVSGFIIGFIIGFMIRFILGFIIRFIIGFIIGFMTGFLIKIIIGFIIEFPIENSLAGVGNLYVIILKTNYFFLHISRLFFLRLNACLHIHFMSIFKP